MGVDLPFPGAFGPPPKFAFWGDNGREPAAGYRAYSAPCFLHVLACCSESSHAVEFTTKHPDSRACWRIFTEICSEKTSPANDPGYIAEWICSPSAIKA